MAFSSRKIIAGNWKMNGLRNSCWELLNALTDKFASEEAAGFDMIVCPPFTLLAEAAGMVDGSPIAVGAQDISARDSGAFTGEVSGDMIRDAGGRFAIVGHSERRQYHGETDAAVREKAAAALRHGLTPIICIGETDAQRTAGEALGVIAEQFLNSVPAGATAKNVIVAYEPVWAIGTGKSAETKDIVEVHAHIRKLSEQKFGDRSVSILYGGSVKPATAGDTLAIPDVDGVLVGGASLKADDFWAIAAAA
ncbi:MAG: triose-phosphate isomerase [Rickettsiales bacterium]|jgi:triosephosphate isomerase|nr:triose-phosphate isomerase [Rickettsiales bacterium]